MALYLMAPRAVVVLDHMLKVSRMVNVISCDASLVHFLLAALNAKEMPCDGFIHVPERDGELDIDSAIFCPHHTHNYLTTSQVGESYSEDWD